MSVNQTVASERDGRYSNTIFCFTTYKRRLRKVHSLCMYLLVRRSDHCRRYGGRVQVETNDVEIITAQDEVHTLED